MVAVEELEGRRRQTWARVVGVEEEEGLLLLLLPPPSVLWE